MKTKLLCTAAIAALVFTACSKEDNAGSTDSNLQNLHTKSDSDGGIHALQSEALANMTQHFNFVSNGESSIVLLAQSGTKITVQMSTLRLNGVPYVGPVQLEYVEIFDRSSMLATNITTMGIAPQQTDEIEGTDLWQLKSGGEFFVNATTQDGQQLDNGAAINLAVPAATTGGVDPGMTAWAGRENANGDVVWKQVDRRPVGGKGGSTYNLDVSFGWNNIDRFASNSGPLTTILVDVPTGYDNTNAEVYLITTGDNMIAPLDTYDPVTELFSEHYGQVPVGLSGYIVFVSENGGQWEYAIISVTFAANSTITVNASDIQTGSQADLENAIDALP